MTTVPTPPPKPSRKPPPPPAPPPRIGDRARSGELTDSEGLALILMALFGRSALKEIGEGGYLMWSKGETIGILEQVDRRLTRIEETLGLEPVSFTIGEADEEGKR